MLPPKSYILLIETDQYSEPFEREITAYCTGIMGEYGGNESDEEFIAFCEENNLDPNMFEDIVNSAYPTGDEEFIPKPCSTAQNEAGDFNDVFIYMHKKPSPELLDIIKKRAIEFSHNFKELFSEELESLNILGIKLLVQETSIEEELSL